MSTVAVPRSVARERTAARPHIKSNGRPAAVVIGLDSHTGLQTARLLRQRGVRVIGMAGDAHHPCCRTRVCDEIVISDITGSSLIQSLAIIGKQLEERAVLFPCTDLSVLQLSRYRHQLSRWFYLVLPDIDVIEMLVDKTRFSQWAEQQGLPVPSTRLLRTTQDVERACEALRFPCILKPGVRTAEWKRHTREKGFYVANANELRRLFRQCIEWSDALVVQEYVNGPDANHFTCNCYFTLAGEPVVTFISRKVRQWPITAGEGSLSEEVRNDEVREATLRLFRSAGYRGLGYVEFKKDARTGQYLILEPNVGRPTGRAAQAEAAGVELMFTQYCDAAGLPLPRAHQQKYAGVKWLHVRRDMQAAYYHWRRGELTVREWLRSLRGRKAHALFSWTDPLPFCADLWYSARQLMDARRRAALAHGGEEHPSA